MPPLTRAQRERIYNHIIVEILNEARDGPIDRALIHDGINTAQGMITLQDNTIEVLTYTDDYDPNNVVNNQLLRLGDANTLKMFIRYLTYRQSRNLSIPRGEEWLTITNDDFEDFRTGAAAAYFISLPMNSQAIATHVVSGVPPPVQPRHQPSQLEAFIKKKKLDVSLYPTLTKDNLFDEYRRTLEATAHHHDLYNVIDHTYTPNTPEEQELLKQQSIFLYTVFIQTLKTEQGKMIVREHENDHDGREVYKKLVAHYSSSTTAQLTASDTLKYITNTKLGSGEWKGNTESFILYWKNQVRLYDSQVVPAKRLHEDLKQTILKNAVNDVAELRQVKANAQQLAIHNGQQLTYQQYYDLLISAAQAFDKKNPQGPSVRRQIYSHDVQYDDSYDYDNSYDDHGHEQYDIDCPISTISANVSQRNPNFRNGTNGKPSVRLPIEAWSQLSRKERDAWLSITPSNRETILKSIPKNNDTHESPSTHDVSFTKFIKALQHEIDSHDRMMDKTAPPIHRTTTTMTHNCSSKP